MRVLCFDIGGTAIKYSIIENDIIGKVYSIETRKDKNTNYILEDILKIIPTFNNLDAIGISTAGVVDSDKGEIIFAGPTIPNYTGEKIKETIENKFNIKCFVENDVNSAAFGEYTSSKYTGTTVCLTIGTGVGGAIIINDEVYKGNTMMAGEIGYMPYNGGYFQDYASTTYLVDEVSKKLNCKVNGKYIFEEAKRGNQICIKAIETLINNLCNGLLNIIYILNPKNIIIGGGITAQGQYLEDMIVSTLKHKLIDNKFNTNIQLAKLENKAGLLGIYYIIKNIYGR